MSRTNSWNWAIRLTGGACAAVFAPEARPAEAAASQPTLEATANFRAGIDTNPAATHGSGAAVLGGDDAYFSAIGAGLSATWAPRPNGLSAKLSYAAEATLFDGWRDEQFTTHRFGAAGTSRCGDWKLSSEASALWIDGSKDTLASIAGCNANATTLWRERRAQTQTRAKLGAEQVEGSRVWRWSGTWLDYDYHTRVAAGKIAFADRRDVGLETDLGWRRSATSLWLAGVRMGRQDQDTVPLPGGEFDYSSRSVRVVGGWEGKLAEVTTLNFSAGPDFRHYDGAVDSRVFAGRDRTTFWTEAALATKFSPRWSGTAKATRWAWLSSTGKSAYSDTAGEAALVGTLDARTSIRVSGKVHRCAYFPAVRDDWEGFAGVGLTRKVEGPAQLTVDLLYHAGWNGLGWLPEREFSRFILQTGAGVRF